MDLVHSCNGRHRQCSRHHADLVQGYREERYRQEISLEQGEAMQFRDHDSEGLTLITFKDWLRGSRHGRGIRV
ncbi:hypothetical protein SEA_DUMPTRUCK_94 [Gordonia phage DumpTruck]|nr:hypothetical protein SEA_DUMPTRUCK_94 [Gordonia phage DumpTruck]